MILLDIVVYCYARMDVSKTVDKILALYTKWGSSDYIGESITQIEHALQCAQLASRDARLHVYDDFTWKCVIVAALLHDVGHLIGLEHGEMEMRSDGEGIFANASLGIVGHEGVGAEFLRECGMPSLVCNLVGSHVLAKRYLCSVREGYYDKLSDASKETMRMQGGLLSKEQITDFKSGNMPELSIYIREYDDEGKKKELNLSSRMGLNDYRKMLESVLVSGRFFV